MLTAYHCIKFLIFESETFDSKLKVFQNLPFQWQLRIRLTNDHSKQSTMNQRSNKGQTKGTPTFDDIWSSEAAAHSSLIPRHLLLKTNTSPLFCRNNRPIRQQHGNMDRVADWRPKTHWNASARYLLSYARFANDKSPTACSLGFRFFCIYFFFYSVDTPNWPS